MDQTSKCKCGSNHEPVRRKSDVNLCLYGPNQQEGRTDLVCLYDSGKRDKSAQRIRIYGTDQAKSGINICVCGTDINSPEARSPSRQRSSVNMSSCICGKSKNRSRSCLCSQQGSTTEMESSSCSCTDSNRKKQQFNRSGLGRTLSPGQRVSFDKTTRQEQSSYVDINKGADYIEKPKWYPRLYGSQSRSTSSRGTCSKRVDRSPSPKPCGAAASFPPSKRSSSRLSPKRSSGSSCNCSMESETEEMPTPVSSFHKTTCTQSTTNRSTCSAKSRKASPMPFSTIYSNKSIHKPPSNTICSERTPKATSSKKSFNTSAYSTKSKKSQRSIQFESSDTEDQMCQCCTCAEERKKKLSQRRRSRSAKRCPAMRERPNYFKLYCNQTF